MDPAMAKTTMRTTSLPSGSETSVDDLDQFLLPIDDLPDDTLDEAYEGSSFEVAPKPATWINFSRPIRTQNLDSFDDDIHDISFSDDSRFIDSGLGGECLRDLEDIDFEFVYALHTFVATVEGQANATKGDTMVLLDDSNSYWWLVRVVKDGSIGMMDFLSFGLTLLMNERLLAC
jgi:hypothetical protein